MATKTRTTRHERLRRLRDDFGFWARHCYWIRDKDGHLVPLRLNHAQRIVSAKLDEIRTRFGRAFLYILKARQGGVTTGEQARNLHTIWANGGASVMTLAHNRDDTDKIFTITRRAVDNFPEGLLPRVGRGRTREVTFTGLDSRFWTATAGARRPGMGLTIKRAHLSEFAFYQDPIGTLTSITPALQPTGSDMVLETTASAHGSDAYNLYKEAEKGLNGFTPLFLPWWICDYELYRLPLEADDELGTFSEEEKVLMERHGLEVEQVKWRRLTMANMGRARFLQEYAEDPDSCWLLAGDLFYDGEVLKMLQDRAPRPVGTMALTWRGWNGQVVVYKKQEDQRQSWERERVVIGVDVAEGGAGDRSSWVARTFPSWDLLEVFADNTVEPKALAALLNKRGRLHADRAGPALLVIEKNAHGITVLRELRDEHKYPSGRIYHRTRLDKDTKEPKLEIGWATTEQTKPLLLDAGREVFNGARDGAFDVPSIECIRDGFNVVRDDKGKVDLNGRDVLVAEALAWQGRTYAAGGYGSFTEYV